MTKPPVHDHGFDPSCREWIDPHTGVRVGECLKGQTMPGTVPAGGVWPKPKAPDPVNQPSHYTHLPVECIDITELFNFCLGNAIKYIWRADHKGKPIEDLEKSIWYLRREIARRKREDLS